MSSNKGVPIGITIIRPLFDTLSPKTRNKAYRGLVSVLTFMAYVSYHLSRKAISVVKNTWNPTNCTAFLGWNHSLPDTDDLGFNDTAPIPHNLTMPNCGWEPFGNSEIGLALLDFTYLLSYAFFMFFMGHIGDRTNLRYFLFLGMASSGILTAALGLPLWFHIHSYAYFFVIQFVAGAAQSTGWPSVIAAMGHWFGKGNRGLIMGIWNANSAVGNILGSAIAGIWVAQNNWAWAFVVPGSIIVGVGLLVLLFLPLDPEAIGCDPPQHQFETETPTETDPLLSTNSGNKHPLNTSITSGSDVEVRHDSALNNDTQEARTTPALTFRSALKIPGVLEFALSYFFAKFVPYIFLYWLPVYIHDHKIGAKTIPSEKAADLSTLFDFGGIAGGIVAGVISDRGSTRGLTCVSMLLLSAPLLWVFNAYGSTNMTTTIALLFATGFFVSGPSALIATTVSVDLGNHEVLKGNLQAKATVAAIIDGTGGIGASLGPLITGIGLQKTKSWAITISICMCTAVAAALLLTRVCIREIQRLRKTSRSHSS